MIGLKNKYWGALTVVLLCSFASGFTLSGVAADRLFFLNLNSDGVTGNQLNNLGKVDLLTRSAAGDEGTPRGIGGEAGFVSQPTNNPDVQVLAAGSVGGVPEVAVGGQYLQRFTADKEWVAQWDPAGGPTETQSIDAIAYGDVGDPAFGLTDRIIVTRRVEPINGGWGENDVLIHMISANPMAAQSMVSNPIPNQGVGNSIHIGEFNSGTPGNEILITTTETHNTSTSTAADATTGNTLLYYAQSANVLTQRGGDGQKFINRPISDAVADDFIPSNPGLEYLVTGNNNPQGTDGFGQGSHLFSTDDAPNHVWFQDFERENALGATHGAPPSGLVFNAVTSANLDADPEPEIVLAGSDVIRVLNPEGDAGNPQAFGPPLWQSGPTMQNFIDVVVADVLDDDGVDEIIAGTESGLIFVYAGTGNSSSPYDLASVFNTGNPLVGLAAIGAAGPVVTGLPGDFNEDGTVDAADFTVWSDNRGSTFDLGGNGDETGGSAGIVDGADYALWAGAFGDSEAGSAAGAAVPEPGSMILLLAGLFIAAVARPQR